MPVRPLLPMTRMCTLALRQWSTRACPTCLPLGEGGSALVVMFSAPTCKGGGGFGE